jgi:hypothetical protein
MLASEVTAGYLPGIVSLVARGDDVHVDAIGTPSFADDTPLSRHAIFRIASLTKSPSWPWRRWRSWKRGSST